MCVCVCVCVTREGKLTPGGEADVVSTCAGVCVCRRRLGAQLGACWLEGKCSGITELGRISRIMCPDTPFYKRGGVEIQRR